VTRHGTSKAKERIRNLTIRISQDDYDTLAARAEEAGMTQSEYVRFLIRRARLRVSVEVTDDEG